MDFRCRHKLVAAFTALMLALSSGGNIGASNSALTDYDWQALYIMKFGLSYVEWPEITFSENIKIVNVCIYGDSPAFLRSLTSFQTKAASKLKINIKSYDETASCNIIYIAKNKTDYKSIIQSVQNKPVLTVAPIDGFAADGGMVEFVISETSLNGNAPFNSKVKVNFKINYKSAMACNLKIAPELIELSEKVIR